jgi:4-hydroxy-tetrahydrodipicolinate synthase
MESVPGILTSFQTLEVIEIMTMKIDWMRGCATALVTPFRSDGSIDEARLRALVVRQMDGGVRLLVPCGTTGESATMTEDEDARVIALTIEVAGGRAKVIAGAGSNSTTSAIEYSKRVRDAGADAALQVAPWYNKPTQEGLYAHFKAIAEAVPDLPIMLYNVPGRTSSNIAASTTLRLARDCENIVAVKEASGNLSQIMEILRERPAGFSVFSGDDAVTLPLIALGAEGIVSVASNEIPDFMSQMTTFALEGNWDEARRLHYRILPLMDVNFIESSPGPVKAAMAMMGLLEENFRLPLVPVTEKSRARVREVISELGLVETARATA